MATSNVEINSSFFHLEPSGRIIPWEKEQSEPILSPEVNRPGLEEIRYPMQWTLYKKAIASIWYPEEIDMLKDKDDWLKLSHGEQQFITHILAFFVTSDMIVVDNLKTLFTNRVKPLEFDRFYQFQIAIEHIHDETYTRMFEALITDSKKRMEYRNSATTLPSIRAKQTWVNEWSHSSRSFAEVLIAWICMEHIFFSGSFCALFWLKTYKNKMPGLTHSNQLIARDEGLHVEFGVSVYHELKYKLPRSRVVEILKSAVDVEHYFVRDALKVELIGMNATEMCKYTEFITDRLFQMLGYDKEYNEPNPFGFMEQISLRAADNFFEKPPSEYSRNQQPAAGTHAQEIINLDADF